MRRTLNSCGCQKCCVRQTFPNTGSLFVTNKTIFDPVDFHAERNNQLDIVITPSGRPPGDTTSSPFLWKPVTVDCLVWCDDSGLNEIATLRVRVAVGAQHDFNAGGGMVQLGSHIMTQRSGGPDTEIAELEVCLDLLIDGEVEQSARLASLEVRNALQPLLNPLNLLVRWTFCVRDDALFVATRIGGNNPSDYVRPVDGQYLQFPSHVFNPQPLPGPIAYTRMAVSRTSEPLTSVSAVHYAKRRAAFRSPCLPVDVSDYCGDGALANKRAAWPWRSSDSCTVWRRESSVMGAECDAGGAPLSLSLTIPAPNQSAEDYAFDNFYWPQPDGHALANLLAETWELAPQSSSEEPLVYSSFWFADSPNATFTYATAGDPQNPYTYTLKHIEMSAVLDFDGGRQILPWVDADNAPCESNSWSPGIRFVLSAVVNRVYQGESQGDFRWTIRPIARLNVPFLRKTPCEFRPYGTFGPYPNVIPAFSGAAGFTSSIFGTPGPSGPFPVWEGSNQLENAPAWTVQLIE